MIIRRVEQNDFEQWYQMRISLWPDANQPEDREEMQDYLSGETKAVFVAQAADGHLFGFLEANIRPYADGCATQSVGYIEGWFIGEEYRRQGVGEALVKAAEDWARSKRCQEMASDCSLDNEISLSAHLSLGYEEMERIIHFCKPL